MAPYAYLLTDTNYADICLPTSRVWVHSNASSDNETKDSISSNIIISIDTQTNRTKIIRADDKNGGLVLEVK